VKGVLMPARTASQLLKAALSTELSPCSNAGKHAINAPLNAKSMFMKVVRYVQKLAATALPNVKLYWHKQKWLLDNPAAIFYEI
jgi:hypothetical protein